MRASPRPRAGLALALLAAAATLAGCGRRGPLELPPGAPNAKAPAAQQAAADQPDDSAAFKNPVFKEAPAPRPINGPPSATKPNGFFLDPLL